MMWTRRYSLIEIELYEKTVNLIKREIGNANLFEVSSRLQRSVLFLFGNAKEGSMFLTTYCARNSRRKTNRRWSHGVRSNVRYGVGCHSPENKKPYFRISLWYRVTCSLSLGHLQASRVCNWLLPLEPLRRQKSSSLLISAKESPSRHFHIGCLQSVLPFYIPKSCPLFVFPGFLSGRVSTNASEESLGFS